MTLDEQTQAFLERARGAPRVTVEEVGLAAFRDQVEQFRAFGFEPEEVSRVDELSIPMEEGESVPVRLYRPRGGAERTPAIVWLHGGSWVRASVDLLDGHFRVMANRSGCAVAAVEYSLAPEAKLPRQIEEGYAASRWLQREAGELGLDEAAIAIGGDSSGGNLAAAIAQLDRVRREVGFAFQSLLLPVLDCTFSSSSWQQLGEDFLLTAEQLEWALEQYAPGVDRSDPRLSPLFAELPSGLPPTLILVGEYDPLKDDGRRYAERLSGAGVAVSLVELPGMIHHAIAAPALMDTGKDAILRIGSGTGEGLRAAAGRAGE